MVIIFLSIFGISKLEVENSFINYFDKNTEIYKGMKKIDDELGGTTPLNVILKFPSTKSKKIDDDEFSEWDEDNEKEEDRSKYWFTRDKMDKILKVHDYLDSLPEIGKVLSFGSILTVAEDLNEKKLTNEEIYFKSSEEMYQNFRDIPEIFKNNLNVSLSCSYFPTSNKPQLPEFKNNLNLSAED